MSLETVKCPYCGYVYQTDVKKILEDGRVNVARKTEHAVESKSHQEEYIDLKCPSCGQEFEWQIT